MEDFTGFLIELGKLIWIVMSDWNYISGTVIFILFIIFMTIFNIMDNE